MEPNQFIIPNRYGLRLFCIAASVVGLAFMSAVGAATPKSAPAVKVQVQSNYGKLPLSFDVNQGQTDSQVKFLSRGHGYVLFLTPNEAVLSLKKLQAHSKASALEKSPPASEAAGAVLRMQLVGANPAPRVLGKDALSGRGNYLIGKDPAKWHTKVPTYGKIAYEDVYPGVNLVYYGNQGQLEYDFVVAPGADPSRVKLAFRGADKIEINPEGELVLHTASGELRMHKPIIYQEIDGVRKPVDGGYVLKEAQEANFQVAAYDAERPLVIDPVLDYSTYLGGSVISGGGDIGWGIAVDQQGQAYVMGITGSSNFPTENALQPTFGGGFNDAFVAKLNKQGSALVYSTYLGGSGDDQGQSIAVDKRGQAYVTGETYSTDFPTKNALQPVLGGSADAFVAQLTADGAALRYSTYLGGSEYDSGSGIAVDKWGRPYVTGTTSSTDFPIKNALQPTLGGSEDAFVAQLTADGAALGYATYLGGSRRDGGFDIAVDQLGQAYVTGGTFSTDFPTKNALQPTFGGDVGDVDAFVTKITVDGAAFHYSTYLGGSRFDACEGIAVDERGQASVTGRTSSLDFPTKNALQPTFGGGSHDVFVAQFTADGAALRYSTYLGGSGEDLGYGIALNKQGQAYVTGGTDSTDFPTKNAIQPALGGSTDVFVAKFSADGAALRYSTYLGGGMSDLGAGIVVDTQGQAYVAGSTSSSDFPTKNPLQPTLSDFNDAFVAKIGNNDRPCEHGKKCKDAYEDHGKNKHGSQN
jgi:hypothetical protein